MTTPFSNSVPVHTVTLSGTNSIDSLIYGYKWGGVAGTAVSLTYSFPGVGSTWISGYGNDEELDPSVRQLSLSEQAAATAALTAWSNVANITFTQVADNSSTVGDIRFDWTHAADIADSQAAGYYPSSSPSGGDIWLNTAAPGWDNFVAGSYGYLTLIHESGHALGLKHSFSVSPAGVNNTVLPTSQDGLSNTVMSYSAISGNPNSFANFNPTTPMMDDIAAMQYLYGANMSYHAGDDTYTFHQGQSYFQTIWDAGGNDTIVWQATTQGATIDLNGGHWSSLGNPLTFFDDNGNPIPGQQTNTVAIYTTVTIENATGGDANDTLIGNNVNNVLDGGAGADIMAGGLGNDTYIVDNVGDTVTENAGEGTDLVQSSVNYTLGANIENLTLTGSGNLNGTGNTLSNVITGNSGDNTLNDGNGGTDTLIGGLGNDTYIVSNAADIITENASEGTDTVQSSVSYTLGANIENLTLTGGSVGTSISAKVGQTNMYGMFGLNTDPTTDANYTSLDYAFYANADGTLSIVENGNFLSGFGTYSTADVFTVTYDGSAIHYLKNGVELRQVATAGGQTFYFDSSLYSTGFTLNSVQTGGAALIAGSTNIAVNGSTITKTGSAGWGNAGAYTATTATPPPANLNGTGNALDNVITDNGGTDTLIGGLGNDTYIVSNAADIITENASEGTDTVQSSVSYTLGANIENLTLTGGSVGTSISAKVGQTNMYGMFGLNTDPTTDANYTSLDYAFYANADGTLSIVENGNFLSGFGTYSTADVFTVTYDGSAIHYLKNGVELRQVATAGGQTFYFDSSLYSTGFTLNSVQTGGAALIAGSTNIAVNGSTITKTGSAGWGNAGAYTATTGTPTTANLNGTGNTLSNIITGNSGDNTLNDGNGGTDTLIGGLGNDTYVINNAADIITENASEGTDTVQSSVSYTLGANIENLTLTGSGNLNGTGNSLNNIITGNAGNNILDGGTGTDTLIGGTGNDTYIVNNTADIITENASEGTDLVQSSVNYTLGANIENLTLTGSGNLNGTGNTLSNTLTGNSGDNTLNDGNGGTDTLIGGLGNDTYIVSNAADIITENASEGTDTVQSSVSYTLGANIENLTLTGGSVGTSISAKVGQTNMYGMFGLNTDPTTDANYTSLDYAFYANADGTLSIVENGNFLSGFGTYSTADVFTVTYDGSAIHYLKNGVELRQVATAGGQTFYFDSSLYSTGFTLNSVQTGGAALIAGSTNIAVNGSTITKTGSAGWGNAGAYTATTATPPPANLNGTGNALDNVITDNGGTDTLIGGLGNDTYIVSNAADIITENASEGTDTVQSSVSYTLGANIENLTLTGGSVGTSISAKVGQTNMYGMFGLNTDPTTDANYTSLDYAFYANADGTLSIVENGNFLSGFGTYSTADVFTVTYDGSAIHYLKNGVELRQVATAGGQTFYFDSSLYSTGFTLNSVQTGGAALIAGSTNIAVNGSTITKTGSAGWGNAGAYTATTGTPTTANLNGTGNTLSNIITGNSGDNTLNDGNGGTDTLIGGLGNDTYVINNAADIITENASEGTDTVQSSVSYTLGANIENLTLTGSGNLNGTGNSLNNIITGNAGNNILDGGTGTDTLIGGTGNDTYIVNNTADIITENASEGTDLVQSSVNYTLGANIENLTLTGSGNLNGTGNTLSNTLTGNSGDNTLNDGNGGTDTLIGGLGNDTYIVSNAADIITENASEGTDTVQSSVSYTLGANIENLTLTGGSVGTSISAKVGQTNMYGMFGLNTDPTTDANYTSLDYAFYANADGTLSIVENGNFLSGFGTYSTADVFTVTYDGSAIHYLKNGVELRQVATAGGQTFYFDSSLYSTGFTLNSVQTGGAALIAGSTNIAVNGSTITKTGSAGWGNAGAYTATTGTPTTANLNGTGNTLSNIITGNSGDNTLNDGNGGTDTLIGGLGNDTYVINNAADIITENASEGTDTVQSSVSYTLGANIENLTLTGSGNLNGTGNSLNNIITGNAGNNILDGGTGTDTLIGGTGNDTYIVNNTADIITENASEGTDLVQSSVNYTLGANIENLTLTGSGNLNGTGNTLSNVITGNSGDNTLNDGNGGTDTLIGGLGNDTYIVSNAADIITENASEGTDTVQSSVSYTLGANIENLTLTGGSVGTSISAKVGQTNMYGMFGLNTDPTTDANYTSLDYAFYANADGTLSIVENGNFLSGFGTYSTADVFTVTYDGSAIHYLKNGVELRQVATAGGQTFYFDSSLYSTGFTLNSVQTGGAALIAGSTNIAVNGSTITKTGSAGWGNAGAYTATTATPPPANLNGTGNALDNVITGNGGNNILDGGGGADTLIGGAGNDTYLFSRGYGVNTIIDNSGNDTLALGAGINYDQLWFDENGNNLEISVIGTTDKITIQDWYLGSANHVESFLSGDGKTLQDSQVQTLVQAMAGFAPPSVGQTTFSSLPTAYQTALAPVLAANWH